MTALRTPQGRSRPRRVLALGVTAATALGVLQVAVATTPASAAVACTATYSIDQQWDVGFQGTVSVVNNGDALSSWTLGWTFPGNQQITQLWNGKVTQTGAAVSAANESYNGSVASAGTFSVGFLATYSGSNAQPTAFTLNGVPCTGPNQAPTVSLTAPTSGATVGVGDSVTLTATASDSDGTISKVEFYDDSTLIGTATSAPWSVTWKPTAAHAASITAKAYDDKGASTSSAPAGVTVAAGPSVTTSVSALSVKQGESGTFGVALSKAPASDVTVTVGKESGGSAGVTATPATLTFTPANWSTAQTVTVASAASGTAGKATVTVTAPGYAAASVAVTELKASTSVYAQRFTALYDKIHDPKNGYFSPQGIPYHSVETLIVEAPDYGHQTTSEAFSYLMWLEAEHGRLTGDWKPYNDSWALTEKYLIPSHADQPTNSGYNASKPATYAPESPNQTDYPAQLQSGVSVGQDPIASELSSTYGTPDVYGMHWLLDADNKYGFGHCGDGTTKPAYMNSYQRGSSESVWETIPQPSCDTFAFGGKNGYLDLFTGDSSYAKQWKYTDAPDADARAVQAAYWANKWAGDQGKAADVAGSVAKAAKMGDYLRYSFFDKYFKKIGNCVGPSTCAAGTGKDSEHYLLSWYYAWGGSLDTSSAWAWRIGDGASHQGYQNPLAAYALSSVDALKPKSATGAQDWAKSLDRQLEFYRWLQSSEGAIAGGATNSWDGQYGTPPAGDTTFYGMYYDPQPVWHDPASNKWFGFQTWSMERVAEYYQVTGDAKAKAVLDKWVAWVLAQSSADPVAGTFSFPEDLTWTGTPDTWNAASPGGNAGLHVTVASYSHDDVGVAGSLAKTLSYYAAKSGNTQAQTLAKNLLDVLWTKYSDDKGVAAPAVRTDYSRFNDKLVVPPGWTGKTPTGDTIDANSTFLSIRSWYKQDPDWPKVQAYLDGGAAPTFTYHRFWAQADVATALAVYDELFG